MVTWSQNLDLDLFTARSILYKTERLDKLINYIHSLR